MWILTPDKALYNTENIIDVFVAKRSNGLRAFCTDRSDVMLADYSSKQEAGYVLNLLIGTINEDKKVFVMPDKETISRLIQTEKIKSLTGKKPIRHGGS